MRTKLKRTRLRLLAYFVLLLFLLAAAGAGLFYHVVMQPNLTIGQPIHFYIPTGSSYHDVLEKLADEDLLRKESTFHWLAVRKNYPNRVLPGRYLLKPHWGNNALINHLRSGNQDPVRLTFNNIRTKQQLAGVIGAQMEVDSASIVDRLNDASFMANFGMGKETALLLFIPNTYEVFWNTPTDELFTRMHREFVRFWNEDRLSRANEIKLSPKEVMILASIVQRETTKRDEMARIAGVYINRLNRNMPLQADPTVVYAVGDFSLTRVLYKHLTIDSPYNTYMYAGLPPGPIGLPEPFIIDHVLHYEQHRYLFFCARDDFSGYHSFARTYSEHLVNARRYHHALNQRQRSMQ